VPPLEEPLLLEVPLEEPLEPPLEDPLEDPLEPLDPPLVDELLAPLEELPELDELPPSVPPSPAPSPPLKVAPPQAQTVATAKAANSCRRMVPSSTSVVPKAPRMPEGAGLASARACSPFHPSARVCRIVPSRARRGSRIARGRATSGRTAPAPDAA
jgi:hypothetical protein